MLERIYFSCYFVTAGNLSQTITRTTFCFMYWSHGI